MGLELGAIAAIVGAVATVAGTAATLASGGGPDLPPVPKPKPPPAVPPPPATPPPPPTDTQAGEAVGEDRRKRATRFGVANTLLTSPLGGGADLTRPGGKSLLGG